MLDDGEGDIEEGGETTAVIIDGLGVGEDELLTVGTVAHLPKHLILVLGTYDSKSPPIYLMSYKSLP